MLKLDISGCEPFVTVSEFDEYVSAARKALQTLDSKTGRGSEFTGWNELPEETTEADLHSYDLIAADWAQMGVDLVVVTGIGGSYLGAHAMIEAMRHPFRALLGEKNGPDVVFAGHNLSEEYYADLMDLVRKRDVAVIVISKSGTTTEPAVAFRMLRRHLEQRYGSGEAARRIVAVTDPVKGALRDMAAAKGYRTFPIPPDIGGRFSVLTAVGLLPMAVAGLDIRSMMEGARHIQRICDEPERDNPAIRYAALRNLLRDKGFDIEMLVAFNPRLREFAEWWKQLFGESEGKEGRGIFPASAVFTTDLHSLGQYIQDGARIIFETVLQVANSRREAFVEEDADDADGLNYLAGTAVDHCNEMARIGTRLAHIDAGVPNITVSIEQIDEYNLGQMIYFFEKACALSAYVSGVNPFDQPGVEAYKNNMFALLGKPGYEERAEELRERI